MPRPRLAAVASILAMMTIEARAQQPAPAKPAFPTTRSEHMMPPELAAKLPKLDEIRPQPAPIPEPPPHEGAMADLPYIVDAPDILTIDVVDALPGRPIVGEYLVRGDGTISLGIYGDLHVRGLTLDQIKQKLILHLRTYLTDRALGLILPAEDAEHADFLQLSPMPANDDLPEMPLFDRPGKPALPGNPVPPVDAAPVEPERPAKVAPVPAPRPDTAARVGPGARRRSRLEKARLGIRRPVSAVQVPVVAPAAEPSQPMRVVPAAANFYLSVGVRVYNSKVYYVDGDVLLAGRFPSQGNETILDAIYNAGGLSSTADSTAIRLYRPGRGGKPAREYLVDLAKIKAGDAALNYQLFPGDRLIVGRDKVVAATVQLDRLTAPLNSMVNSWLTYAYAMRSLASMGHVYGPAGSQEKPGEKGKVGDLPPDTGTPSDAAMDGLRREFSEMVKRLSSPDFREIRPAQIGEALGRPAARDDEPRPKP